MNDTRRQLLGSLPAVDLLRTLDSVRRLTAVGDMAWTMPTLNAVRLRITPGGWLTATGCDLYRLGVARASLATVNVRDWQGLLPRRAVKEVVQTLDTLPPAQEVQLVHDLQIGVDPWGAALVFECPDPMTGPTEEGRVPLQPGEYPASADEKLREALAQDPTLPGPFGVNLSLLAGFKDAQRHAGEALTRVWGSTWRGALAVAIGDNFVGAIATVTRTGGVQPEKHDRDSWAGLLGEKPLEATA